LLTAISQSINRDLPLQFEKVMRKELAQFAPAVAQLVKEPLQQLEKALDRTVRGCRARERERERERETEIRLAESKSPDSRCALGRTSAQRRSKRADGCPIRFKRNAGRHRSH
jgi:hypothetical protein